MEPRTLRAVAPSCDRPCSFIPLCNIRVNVRVRPQIKLALITAQAGSGHSVLQEQYGDRLPKKLDASGRWTAIIKGTIALDCVKDLKVLPSSSYIGTVQ